MIRPDFFTSESLAACSMGARLAFIGLWVMGDDNGNCKLSVRKLAKQIFALDNIRNETFANYLAELEAQGCIRVYEVGGERYINVPNFSVYQTVKNPSKTSNPMPPEGLPKVTKALQNVNTTPALPQRYPSANPALTPINEGSKEGETTPKVVVSPAIQVDTEMPRVVGKADEGPASDAGDEPTPLSEYPAMCQRLREVVAG